MLGRMDGAIDTQDLLSSGNRRIVNPAGAKDIEAGPEAGAGQKRKPRAARSAMQIQTEGSAEAANFRGLRLVSSAIPGVRGARRRLATRRSACVMSRPRRLMSIT